VHQVGHQRWSLIVSLRGWCRRYSACRAPDLRAVRPTEQQCSEIERQPNKHPIPGNTTHSKRTPNTQWAAFCCDIRSRITAAIVASWRRCCCCCWCRRRDTLLPSNRCGEGVEWSNCRCWQRVRDVCALLLRKSITSKSHLGMLNAGRQRHALSPKTSGVINYGQLIHSRQLLFHLSPSRWKPATPNRQYVFSIK